MEQRAKRSLQTVARNKSTGAFYGGRDGIRVLWCYGVRSCEGMGSDRGSEKFTEVFQKHLLPSSFPKTSTKFSTWQWRTTFCYITAAWLRERRVQVLTWPQQVQDKWSKLQWKLCWHFYYLNAFLEYVAGLKCRNEKAACETKVHLLYFTLLFLFGFF